MFSIDPLLITAIGLAAGALARRFAPRAVPRTAWAACSLGVVGAWVMVAGLAMAPKLGHAPTGATAGACALLGAALALDLFHLLLRRRPTVLGGGIEHRNPGYGAGLRNSSLVNTSVGSGPSALAHLAPAGGVAAAGARRAPRRVLLMSQGRNLARKRRVARGPVSARGRARAGPSTR